MKDSPAPNADMVDLSLVMPCYNEQECVANTVRRLLAAFQAAGHRLEIVTVDNGSTDETAEILENLRLEYPSVRICTVPVNQGYGNGILSGIPHCSAEWIGFIPADGQVDPADVVHLFESVLSARGNVLGKVRRRFRMDGLQRKFISIAYNALVNVFWPGIQSLDINGTPKLMRRSVLQVMNLQSRGWFLDPEMMIKAHYMGLRVLELNAFARMRGNGISHVRTSTCWEFLRNLMDFRFSARMRRWKQENRAKNIGAASGAQPELAISGRE
jgi:glycosyltransferase involved in cell wall biosynthesis